MKNQYAPKAHEEDREFVAAAISLISACYGFLGMLTFLDGCEVDDPDMSKEGLRMMLGIGNLSIFAPQIREGTLTMDQLLDYLDRQ